MKLQIFLLLVGVTLSSNGFSQGKKPTLMILPSDNWCNQRYFMEEFDNQGTKQKVPDYKLAFQEDTELGQAISKIGSLMIERGYVLKDAEQEIKAIEDRTAEDNMTTSKSGSVFSETPLDKLKNKAKADIIIQVWWKVNKINDAKSVSFILEAFDAYTSKRIASSTGTGKANSEDIVPVLLQKAIQEYIDKFSDQLQSYFDDMVKNGREIILSLKKWDSWDKDFDTEFNGEELTTHINKWLKEHCVAGQFNLSDASENRLNFEQVRIPLVDKNGQAIDARQFSRTLKKYLQGAPFNLDVKIFTRGLGEAILIVGEK